MEQRGGEAGEEAGGQWMEAAFALAEEALQAAEVPVGAVLVGRWTEAQTEPAILASGRNQVNEERNATRHAELVLFDKLFSECEERGTDAAALLSTATLYVTVEPCAMCAAALCQLRVPRVVFGCVNPRFGGMGGVVDIPAKEFPAISVTSKVQEGRAVELLRRFYARENAGAPKEVRKAKPDRVPLPSRPPSPPPSQSPQASASSSLPTS